MVCPSVGDNPQALATNYSINIHTILISVDLALYEIFHAIVYNIWQGGYNVLSTNEIVNFDFEQPGPAMQSLKSAEV